MERRDADTPSSRAAKLNAEERAMAESFEGLRPKLSPLNLAVLELFEVTQQFTDAVDPLMGCAYMRYAKTTFSCPSCKFLMAPRRGAQKNFAKLSTHVWTCGPLLLANPEGVKKAAALSSARAAKEVLHSQYVHEKIAGSKQSASTAGLPSLGGDTSGNNNKKGKREVCPTITTFEQPLPAWQYKLAFKYLCVLFFVCNIPMAVIDHWAFRRFVNMLRPSFAEKLPAQGRKALRDNFQERYIEAHGFVEEALETTAGLRTIGIDGHRDARRRVVWTISVLKLGLSVFVTSVWSKLRIQSGDEHAKEVEALIGNGNVSDYIGIVCDNASNMKTMQKVLAEKFHTLLFVGCVVHVLDLLVEDIVDLIEIKSIVDDLRFLVTFIKGYDLLHEAFLAMKGSNPDLVVYPETRFAYVYLMARHIIKSWLTFQLVLNSGTYKYVERQYLRKQGAKFRRFKRLVEDIDTKRRATAVHDLLVGISSALHYVSGNNVPASHVYPLVQEIYTFVQSLPESVTGQLKATTCEEVTKLVAERWSPKEGSMKKGVDVAVLATCFLLNPACIAISRAYQPREVASHSSILSTAKDIIRQRLGESDTSDMIAHLRAYRERALVSTSSNTMYESIISDAQVTAKEAVDRVAKAHKALEEQGEGPNNKIVMLLDAFTSGHLG